MIIIIIERCYLYMFYEFKWLYLAHYSNEIFAADLELDLIGISL